ncbi:MAG: bifunctional glutamate N-acetyltransferase/amino-acid acetyltransferase ArgJ [Candidatus Methanofastidiosia archaeon]
MNEVTIVDGHIWSVPGFSAFGAHCNLRKKRKDFTIIKSDTICNVAAVYTTNKVIAAPLIVTKDNLKNGKAQAIICNSGVANACTGDQGIKDAHTMASVASRALECAPDDVVVASTGVIGVPLPMDKITKAIYFVSDRLGKECGTEAAEGILTTDTIVKEVVVKANIRDAIVTIGAIAKGSGMIHPNMATMLSFIVTDALISSDVLSMALSSSVDKTYNMMSVDGDTSTNDMVVVLANGKAGNSPITLGSAEYDKFLAALDTVNETLAKMIVKDGEGASKMFEVHVINAPTLLDARKIGKSIVSSSLVKSAVHGGDPNWGRIVCAAGYSNAYFNPSLMKLTIAAEEDALTLFEDGSPTNYSEKKAQKLMQKEYITFIVDLKNGSSSAKAWGCDLTSEYVKINAHYRT